MKRTGRLAGLLFALISLVPLSAAAQANETSKAGLARIGWEIAKNSALVRTSGRQKGYIPKNYLEEADLEWKDGTLGFVAGHVVPESLMPMILEGLWIFVQAGQMPPIETGKILAAWGLPPVIDGRKLVNPDGTATYYGQMLRLLYSANPDALKRTSVERLSQALDLLDHARDQAFKYQSADIAKTDIDRARLMLFAPIRAGETKIGVAPYEDISSLIDGFQREIKTDRDHCIKVGDRNLAEESTQALATLGTLKRQHYHEKLDLPEVPAPGRVARKNAEEKDSPKRPRHSPLATGLPRLLKVLDRINGRPLTPEQQENLIKSFPMGDLVWRMGAQNLWRRGFTGKGVKVAVIDGGIGDHEELVGVVQSHTNFIPDRGKALVDDHGTHNAGTIHALAPDALIRDYTVFANEHGNPILKESGNDNDATIIRAIDQAVKDGNTIINMSLASHDNSPSDIVARKVEEYSKRGVIFVIAAGNERDSHSIEPPSVAPNAITAGALDAAGRAADFSSYGTNFDSRKLAHVVKSVFMAPGTNIYSTVIDSDGKSSYESMHGSSMATAVISGVAALLAQAATTITPNPIELSQRVSKALVDGSEPMPLDKLPSNVPIDQQFLIVRPLASLNALRRKSFGAPRVELGTSWSQTTRSAN